MTEAEWLADRCGLPPALEEVARRGTASRRKLLLLCCAYCRRVWEWIAPLPWTLIPPERRTAALVELAERHADWEAELGPFQLAVADAADAFHDWEVTLEQLVEDDDEQSLKGRQEMAWHVWHLFDPFLTPAAAGARPLWDWVADRWCGLADEVGEITFRRGAPAEAVNAVLGAEAAAGGCLVRDIFGNPFRSVTFSPTWRTDTVLLLARQMYESRDFSAMPILADALQDAGCDEATVLDHCRGPGPHVRGCWVVDLVLGKEERPVPAMNHTFPRCTV
jgi:hypothetical protein